MRALHTFLLRYQKLKIPEQEVRVSLARVVSGVLQKEVSPQQITLRGSQVFFSVSATQHSELFLHREEIVSQLKKETGITLSLH